MIRPLWKTAVHDEADVTRIMEHFKLPRPVAMTLAGRQVVGDDAVDAFLKPRLSKLADPYELPGMERAVERIWEAIDRQQTIVVFGDYDVDGITSSALLISVLRELGGEVESFLPHRVDDGYGLAEETVLKCIERFHPALIVTVDCGTSSFEAVETARAKGVDVVVTDHHEPGEKLADCVALVNPKLGEVDDLKNLAGVGVAFKCCHGMVKWARAQEREEAAGLDLKRFLDLVAVGTVADMVPLQGENRSLARYGIERINQTELLGLQALIDVSGISTDIESYHIGFMLGPRLNAAGRLGTAEASLELLLSTCIVRAGELARDLDASNQERKEIEKRAFDQALKRIESFFDPEKNFGLVVFGEDWHPGVIGIVASRIARHFNRPTVVIAVDEEGVGRGSCRSIENFSLVDGLNACSEWLLQHGGHQAAAGLGIEKEKIEGFAKAFDEHAAGILKGKDLRPVLAIDAWMDLGDVDETLIGYLNQMGPFGLGNSRPVWAARNVRVVGQPKVVGTHHLKMSVTSGGRQLDAICFGQADKEVPDGPLDLAFYPSINTFRGYDNVQLVVQDFRASEA